MNKILSVDSPVQWYRGDSATKRLGTQRPRSDDAAFWGPHPALAADDFF